MMQPGWYPGPTITADSLLVLMKITVSGATKFIPNFTKINQVVRVILKAEETEHVGLVVLL
jgi:hypothetical protein